jgi:Mg/Co/Ni transporter MgtE
MDEEKIDLALAFLQSQPAAAAAILEQQPLEQVAAFLAALPHTYGALVMTRMLPQYGARLCRSLQPTVAAGMLSQMDISLVAAVMRQCDDELAERLLDLLPDKTRLACRLLLNYSEDAVGAWMHANVSTLPVESSVDEAIQRIRDEQQALDIGILLVVDRERYLHGTITPTALMRAPPNTPITSVITRDNAAIAARTALKTAVDNPLWAERDTIPVVNRMQKLVGVLRHLDLRNGLQQISISIQKPRGGDPVTGIFEVYGNSLLTLFSTVNEITRDSSRAER